MPPKLIVPVARTFASYARALIQYTWKGTDSVPQLQENLEEDIKGKPGLSKTTHAIMEGGIHVSPNDLSERASGQLLDAKKRRITSVHLYVNGRVTYSNEKFNTGMQSGDGTKPKSTDDEVPKDETR